MITKLGTTIVVMIQTSKNVSAVREQPHCKSNDERHRHRQRKCERNAQSM